MKSLRRVVSIVALLALAACGGGGGDSGTAPFPPVGGGPPGGGAATPTAGDLVLTLSSNNVSNNGTESVVATAIAIDANRNVVAGVPVTIGVNGSAVASPSGPRTGADGQVSALIGIGSDRTNRTITVTATSGSVVKTALLTVQDAGGAIGGTASDLLLTVNSPTIPNTGLQPVTVTATALDAKRNILPGVIVSISVDAGATAAPSGTTTNASGVVTAVVSIGGNPTLRLINVTATTAGLVPRKTVVQVVAASVPSAPTAADLSLSLSAGSLINGGTSTLVATATAVDANRNALAGIPITISVDNNAVATVSGTTSNAQGVVTANVGIGSDRSNRSITVTASSGSITKSATFAVVGATLSASFSPRVDAGSIGNQIEYRLVDANGSPMANQSISVSSAGLPGSTGNTDVNGRFNYFYRAPNVVTATTLTVLANAAGDSRTQVISVQAPGSSVPIAALPQSASLTPTPSVVSVNSVGSTTNQVELRALFLGANNLPVPNVRVRFGVDPANSSDGVATQVGGAVYAYSDATGVARGTFIPGQRSSPTNGVTVRACWGTGDFDINAACPAAQTISNTLTIASEALSVNIRTNNLIKTGAAGLTYIKEYVVMVVDAAGQAKADVLITPSVDLTGYYKGDYSYSLVQNLWVQTVRLANTESYRWKPDPSAPERSAWELSGLVSQPMCPNEDFNRNGIREADVYDPTKPAPSIDRRREDLNWNGDIDPRKSDVAVRMVGSPRTDAAGLAIVQIEYGQNVASWVDFVITVTASGIAGTEARARYVGAYYGIGNLPFPSTAVTDIAIPPAFRVSPYGRATTCTDAN